MSLPPSFVPKSKTRVHITEGGEEAVHRVELTDREKTILTWLQKKPYSDFYLKRKLRIRNLSSLLSRLEKEGFIRIERDIKRTVQRVKRISPQIPTQLEIDFSLDKKAYKVANSMGEMLGKETFSPYLLYGPPEKRESVYFYMIKKVLALGEKALFLVPEIALTENLIEDFQRKLGENVALLHSQLTESRREREWKRIRDGEADVVLGTRSALFAPLEDLGLIIVDEEQDDSYYQKESPSYDARKGAWLRAKAYGSVLIYGSTAPSIETFFKARKKGYLFCLEEEPRQFQAQIFDDRKERGIIPQTLKIKIRERLDRKEAVLIFFNRRGYAPFLTCSRCGYVPRCKNCDIALTYHKKEGRLICHYCNDSLDKPNLCPDCGSQIISKRGFGIEVVEEELRNVFPKNRLTCFDTDVAKSKKSQDRILADFKEGRIDILIGTQLLAHRLDLPRVSFIAVLYPETLLALSDFRASQKTFYSLNQIIRFLRNESTAELFIQTSLPQHFSLIKAVSNDYHSFYNQEIKYRRVMNYPPFSYMAELLLQEQNLRTLARKSREFSSLLKNQVKDVEVLGPALASVSKMRGRSRAQIILKSKNKKSLDSALKNSFEKIKARKSLFVYE